MTENELINLRKHLEPIEEALFVYKRMSKQDKEAGEKLYHSISAIMIELFCHFGLDFYEFRD